MRPVCPLCFALQAHQPCAVASSPRDNPAGSEPDRCGPGTLEAPCGSAPPSLLKRGQAMTRLCNAVDFSSGDEGLVKPPLCSEFHLFPEQKNGAARQMYRDLFLDTHLEPPTPPFFFVPLYTLSSLSPLLLFSPSTPSLLSFCFAFQHQELEQKPRYYSFL